MWLLGLNYKGIRGPRLPAKYISKETEYEISMARKSQVCHLKQRLCNDLMPRTSVSTREHWHTLHRQDILPLLELLHGTQLHHGGSEDVKRVDKYCGYRQSIRQYYSSKEGWDIIHRTCPNLEQLLLQEICYYMPQQLCVESELPDFWDNNHQMLAL